MTTPTPAEADVTLYCHPDDTARATAAADRAYGADLTWQVQPSDDVHPGHIVVVSKTALRDLAGPRRPARDPGWVPVRRPAEALCGHAGCPFTRCEIQQYIRSVLSHPRFTVVTGW